MPDLGSLGTIGATALCGLLLLTSDPAPSPKETSSRPATIVSPKILAPSLRKSGRIYTTALIASAPAQFLIDTGASRTILSKRDAERAGARHLRDVTVATAGGAVTMSLARVPEITIGGETMTDVDVLVSDRIEESLLGLDLLDRLGATHLSLSPN